MELKSCFTTIFFLFLFAAPYFSRGEYSDALDSNEVYEIDYRGPETHSSIPPPDHSHGKPWIHKESSWGHPNYPKSKGSNMGRKVKKIHG
ncbi:uncharacterized protein LOC21407167 [Morus notabilis]|uniref:uncharacterized protein LOC21407167 n=1 Tax=Morus notabilis TaxID=981085 RepID=UPI000CED7E59|nr:uncharacterized protein LOC21407167 [Morus notabilis]